MISGGKTWTEKFQKWLDECKLAVSGILLATREKKFLITFAISFVVFGTLMTLLAGSTAAMSLFWAVDLSGKLKIIGDGFLGLFGVGRNFWDFLLTFSVTFLQSILIGLVVLVWQKRRRSQKEQIVATASNSENVQNAGLAVGLAVLGTGCPTCGTTLLAPVIGALSSTGGYALAGTVSGILTVASIIVALWSLKRIGNTAYALIISERYQKHHQTSSKKEES